jgi:hypothetical protein
LSKDGELLAQDPRLPAQALGIRMSMMEGDAQLDYKKILGSVATNAAKSPLSGIPSPFDFHSDRSTLLAGVDYLVFLQPVTVPLISNNAARWADSSITFIVCGLLRKDRVRSEAIKLSPYTLALTGSLVALGLFSIPFLKLLFIGARERMRHRDMWLLCASLLCVTALITLLMLDAHTRFKLHQRFDNGLRQFAGAINTHVMDESIAAVAQLQVSAREMLDSIGLQGQEIRPLPKCRSPDENTLDAKGSILVDPTVNTATKGAFSYPDFESLYITDACSVQWHKWTPRTTPTTSVDTASQPYYVAAIALQEGQPFGFSPVVARTTGLQLGVYSLPIDLTNGTIGTKVEFAKRNGIAAISTQLRSVNEPVVPSPFQFVLVSRKGEVTFQQAQGPFRGERFFKVVSGGQSLERTALDNQRLIRENPNETTVIRREYRGRMYRMYAIEIPELQQTLVAYYDEANVDSLATRIFGTAAVFTTVLIACILIGVAIAASCFGGRAYDWLWPTPSRAPFYFLGSMCCLCAMIFFYLVRAILIPCISQLNLLAGLSNVMAGLFLLTPMAIIIILGFTQVTVAIERLVIAIPLPTTLLTKPWYRARAYQIFAVIGLVALIAWPTALIVDDAFTMHTAAYTRGVTNDFELAVKHSQLNFAANTTINVDKPLLLKGCPLKSDPPRSDLLAIDPRCLLPDRIDQSEFNLIYASDINYRTLDKSKSKYGVYTNCVDLRHNETPSIGSCTLQPEPWSFTVGLANLLSRFSNRSDLALIIANFFEAQSQSGLSALPLTAVFVLSVWTVGGLLFLVITLYLLVSSVAKHVLGIGLANQLVLDESKQFAAEPKSQWLFLRPSGKIFKDLIKSATLAIDLSDATLIPAFAPPGKGTTLLVHHIESRIESVDWRDALLLLLGSRTEGCVVLVSEIDPLHYLSNRVYEAEDELSAAEESTRPILKKTCEALQREFTAWSTALRRVRKIRTLLAMPKAIDPCKPASNVRRLRIECAPTEPLREIKIRILKSKNLKSYCWRDVVGFVQDAAEPYYRSVFELCSHEEKLVLIQLAQEGLVNPKRIEIIQRLARRGLVVLDPRFKLMNESFRRFIQTVESPERIAEWERTPTHSAWSRLGAPLYALAAVIIAILLFTEQEMFTSIIAVATGAAGTLGSMRNLYSSAIKPVAAIVKNA